MADAALDIVREFASATESAVRRKGMRALGALPSAEAGGLLVDAALDGTDPETARSAEAVLAALGPDECRSACEVMQRHLAERPAKAYALLGRLRLLGGHINVAHPSWLLRLRRAMGLWNELRRGHGLGYWLRGVGPTFFGSWLGVVLGGATYGLLRLPADSEFEAAGGSIVFAWFVLPLAAVWITPTQLHYDRVAGAVSDAMICTVLGAGFLLIVWAASDLSPNVITLLAVTPLMVITARVVVSLVGGSVRIPTLGFLWTLLTAGLAAVLAAWLGSLVVAPLRGLDLDEVNLGATYFVLAFALAWMFTALDRPSASYAALLARAAAPGAVGPRYPAVPWPRSNIRASQARWAGAIVWLMLLSTIPFVIPSSALLLERTIAKGTALKLLLDAGAQTRHVELVPIQYEVMLTGRGLVAIESMRAPDDAKVYRVELQRVSESTTAVGQIAAVAQAGFAGPPISLLVDRAKATSSATLDPGPYRLRVVRSAEEPTGLARVARRASMRLRMGPKADADLDIRIELATEPAITSRK